MLNRKVLVLNQNYEPFLVCGAKKAVLLLFLKKAVLVERYDYYVHSVSTIMPYPSVVRINHYIHKPFKKVMLSRKNIHKRDNHICQYCGENSQPMTVDHIIPKCYGGKDTWGNLVCACIKCNSKKGNRTLADAGMKLLKNPSKPSHLFYLQNLIGKPHTTWKAYLFLK